MTSIQKLPWLKINDFILNVGENRDPYNFCKDIIMNINTVIPCDKARLHFLSDTGKINESVLFGVEKKWNDAFIQYYSRISNNRFSLTTRLSNWDNLKAMSGHFTWTDYENDEFFNHYIKPQKIKDTIGFRLQSNNNITKTVFALERTSDHNFTDQEFTIITIIQKHLDNLNRNLYVNINTSQNTKLQTSLTKREFEIAGLLQRGLTPQRISDRLCISHLTAYKHISNIHMKLNVSNRQELLLKLIELS